MGDALNGKIENGASIDSRIRRIEKAQEDFGRRLAIKTVIAIACGVALTGLIMFGNPFLPQVSYPAVLSSGYEIYDMKGNKVDTFVSWKLVEGDLFHIHVMASQDVTTKRIADVRDVVFSNDTVLVNGAIHYVGWEGALKTVNTTELNPIPVNFHVTTTQTGTGNVLIYLTDAESGDGYSGYTKSIIDGYNHQILKSEITIYGVDKLTDDDLKAVLRHELGHALGLAHSNDPGDMMNPVVKPGYEYISQCDIRAIAMVYNGHDDSQVACK